MTVLLVVRVFSAALTWYRASGYSRLEIFDHPNERSLHACPVPCCGGIAILLAMALGWGWVLLEHGMPDGFIWIVTAAVIVASISLLDDIFQLPIRVRLLIHVLAAIFVLVGGYALPWGWAGWIISFLGIIWMLNLYNFMDGMDGFAGGMALLGFGFLGFAGWAAGEDLYALLCWSITASALGFLLFNFPPARIFMGDTGSTTLGLLVAALSLWGIKLDLFPVWFPVLVFSPFVVDATVTLVRRALNRERVWEAHRAHYYQRLVQLGWGHKRTVLAEYVIMLLAGSSALAAQQIDFPIATAVVLVGWGGIYLMIAILIHRHELGASE